jgi:hypothetical protein
MMSPQETISIRVEMRKSTTINQIHSEFVPVVKQKTESFCCVNFKELEAFCKENNFRPRTVMLPEETSTISFEKQEGGFYRQVWDTQGN